MGKTKRFTLSPHQKKVIAGMQEGKPLHLLIMHIRTKIRLEKLGLIKDMQLTELGADYAA